MCNNSKIQVLTFYLLIVIFNLNAQTFQNMVPNGSFETYTQCPYGSSQIYFAAPWTGPTLNSSDYANNCSTTYNVPYYGGIGSFYPLYLDAIEGKAYAGIYSYQDNGLNYREYAQIQLFDSLSNGTCYYTEFYAANGQVLKFATNNIGASFFSSSLTVNLPAPGIIPNVPMHILNYGNPVLEDTVKWTKISGLYEATGTEKFLVIGNLRKDSLTTLKLQYPNDQPGRVRPSVAYIFVDAVSVFSINPTGNLPWSYRDTSIIRGDSVYIGNKMGGQNFHPKWYDINGNYITTNAGIYVRPLVTRSYVVQYTICGVQRADTVEVKVLPDVGLLKNVLDYARTDIRFYPQPANEILNVECLMLNENASCQISIVNNFGQVIKEEELVFKNKKANIGTKDLEAGVYVLRIKSIHASTSLSMTGTVSKKFVVGR